MTAYFSIVLISLLVFMISSIEIPNKTNAPIIKSTNELINKYLITLRTLKLFFAAELEFVSAALEEFVMDVVVDDFGLILNE